MSAALLAASFVALWAGSTLLLSCVPQVRRRRTLTDRLQPYVVKDEGWIGDLEAWLRRQ